MVGDVHIYDPAMPVAAAMTTSVQHIDIVPQRYCGTCSELSSRITQGEPVDCVVPYGEVENDTGYVSHDSRDDSSEQSLYVQSSQPGVSRTDQNMIQNPTHDWLEVIAEDDASVQSMNNMEDLLYQFGNFFRDRFDSELFRFKNAMYEMLSEQQLHMRQIIHSVEMMPEEENDVFPNSESTALGNEENTFQHNLTEENTLCKEKTKSHVLVELASLSCGVTALLNETKYRL